MLLTFSQHLVCFRLRDTLDEEEVLFWCEGNALYRVVASLCQLLAVRARDAEVLSGGISQRRVRKVPYMRWSAR